VTKKFSLRTWIDEEEKRHPGFKEGLRKSYNNPRRDIKSNPPVACSNGKFECYVPTSGMLWNGQKYKCSVCGRNFVHIIPSRRSDGSWDHQKTGWYIQSDSILDIIKSWFKF
jgi:hypothetical protein